MRPADQLAVFVGDALTSGKSRVEIADALAAAGWAPNEVSEAMHAWADTDFSPPVPRPRPYVSARDAFYYGLMFVALAMTAIHLTWLSFILIDRWLPEPGQENNYVFALSSMRWTISTLVVFAPLFLILNARIVRATRADPGKRRSGVRKWFGYITLFLAAMSLLGDLMTIIYAFLNGELAARLLAKSAVVALLAGSVFLYFRQETEGGEDAR